MSRVDRQVAASVDRLARSVQGAQRQVDVLHSVAGAAGATAARHVGPLDEALAHTEQVRDLLRLPPNELRHELTGVQLPEDVRTQMLYRVTAGTPIVNPLLHPEELASELAHWSPGIAALGSDGADLTVSPMHRDAARLLGHRIAELTWTHSGVADAHRGLVALRQIGEPGGYRFEGGALRDYDDLAASGALDADRAVALVRSQGPGSERYLLLETHLAARQPARVGRFRKQDVMRPPDSIVGLQVRNDVRVEALFDDSGVRRPVTGHREVPVTSLAPRDHDQLFVVPRDAGAQQLLADQSRILRELDERTAEMQRKIDELEALQQDANAMLGAWDASMTRTRTELDRAMQRQERALRGR